MSDTPTLFRRGDAWLYSDRIEDLVDEGVLVPVTETLLTREEAANAMMAFLDQHGGDVGQHWPTMEDALAWLGADDE